MANPLTLVPSAVSSLEVQAYETLGWASLVFGLEQFQGMEDGTARFANGRVSLKSGAAERVELAHDGKSLHPFVIDAETLRLARCFRLQGFNAKQSEPNGCLTFGEAGSSTVGNAAIMRGQGGLTLTLQPRTHAAVVLKHAQHFVSPFFFAEDVLMHVHVGRVVKVEPSVVRCEEADVLLSRVRHTGEKTQCFVASSVRFPGDWPVLVNVFHLASQLGFGDYAGRAGEKTVRFERGEIELQGGQITAVRGHSEATTEARTRVASGS